MVIMPQPEADGTMSELMNDVCVSGDGLHNVHREIKAGVDG